MKRLFLLFALAFLSVSSSLAQPLSFSSRGIGGGGALFSPSINRANPDEFYVSCDMSELFHSTDYGASYTQAHFDEFTGGHYSRVNFTSTAGLLYSISYLNEVPTPVMSTDNGNTWAVLAGNPDPYEDYYSIHVDYANPDRVLISDYSAIYFSSNGGTSFTSIHSAASNAGAMVAGVFFDGNNIYVGTNDGVLVSANAGSSWSMANLTGIPSNERISSFAAGKAGGTTRFFCLTGDVSDVYVGLPGSDYWGFMQGVYTCDYGVSNWSAVMNGISSGSDFPMYVAMAENDIDQVYLAGGSSTSDPIVLKSTNAGANWNDVFLASGNQNIYTGWCGDGGDRGWGYAECPFGFDVSDTDPDVLVFSDYGFVHSSSNGGASWRQAYVNDNDGHPMNAQTPPNQTYRSIGLENTSCWQVHWMDANNVWACFSDIRGIRSTDGGQSWSFNYTGHGGNTSYRIAQAPSGNLFMATSRVHDIYQSTYLTDSRLDGNDNYGKLLYSTDNGANWSDLHVFNHPVYWITIDPNNADRAYASVIHYDGGSGVGGVYRCDNLSSLSASTWTLLPDPPRTEKHPASLVVLDDGSLVATYSGRRGSSGFTASSGTFVYDPGSGNWTDVSDPGMHYWTKDIVVDPNDASQNTWYVCVFSGWGGAPNGLGGLYKTTNRGSSWTKLTGNTLDRVTSCTFNPNDPNEVYLTTEGQGLWMSSNINDASPVFYQAATYPFRQPERVFFNPHDNNKVWVSSFGNGMKVGDLSGNAVEGAEVGQLAQVYPNPSRGLIQVESPWMDETEAVLFDAQGRKLAGFSLHKGKNRIDLGDWGNGIYFLRTPSQTVKILLQR